MSEVAAILKKMCPFELAWADLSRLTRARIINVERGGQPGNIVLTLFIGDMSELHGKTWRKLPTEIVKKFYASLSLSLPHVENTLTIHDKGILVFSLPIVGEMKIYSHGHSSNVMD